MSKKVVHLADPIAPPGCTMCGQVWSRWDEHEKFTMLLDCVTLVDLTLCTCQSCIIEEEKRREFAYEAECDRRHEGEEEEADD